MEDTNIAVKLLIAFLLQVISMIFGILPLLKPNFKANIIALGMIKALTGGIFIGIAMIGIIPQAERYMKLNPDTEFIKGYPWNSMSTIGGFFFILLLDKVLQSLVHGNLQNDNDSQQFAINKYLNVLKKQKHKEFHDHHSNSSNPFEAGIPHNNKDIQVSEECENCELKNEHDCPDDEIHEEAWKLLISKQWAIGMKTRLKSNMENSGVHDGVKSEPEQKDRGSNLKNKDLPNLIGRSKDDGLTINEPILMKHFSTNLPQTKNALNRKNRNSDYIVHNEKSKNLEIHSNELTPEKKKKCKQSCKKKTLNENKHEVKSNYDNYSSFQEFEQSNQDEVKSINSMSSGEHEFFVAAQRMELEDTLNNNINITFGYSHLNNENKKPSCDAYLVILAVTFYSFMIGIALGLNSSLNSIIFQIISLILHNFSNSYTFGYSFISFNSNFTDSIVMIICSSFGCPLGITFGTYMHHNFDKFYVTMVLSFCAGFFIYFAANEIIVEEFSVTKYKFRKFFMLLGGVLLVVMGHFFEYQLIDKHKYV